MRKEFRCTKKGHTAVSYTHLDVYKRQSLHCTHLHNNHNNNNNNETIIAHAIQLVDSIGDIDTVHYSHGSYIISSSVYTPVIHVRYAMCNHLCEYSMLVFRYPHTLRSTKQKFFAIWGMQWRENGSSCGWVTKHPLSLCFI